MKLSEAPVSSSAPSSSDPFIDLGESRVRASQIVAIDRAKGDAATRVHLIDGRVVRGPSDIVRFVAALQPYMGSADALFPIPTVSGVIEFVYLRPSCISSYGRSGNSFLAIRCGESTFSIQNKQEQQFRQALDSASGHAVPVVTL